MTHKPMEEVELPAEVTTGEIDGFFTITTMSTSHRAVIKFNYQQAVTLATELIVHIKKYAPEIVEPSGTAQAMLARDKADDRYDHETEANRSDEDSGEGSPGTNELQPS